MYILFIDSVIAYLDKVIKNICQIGISFFFQKSVKFFNSASWVFFHAIVVAC